jgi:hypothetical protein
MDSPTEHYENEERRLMKAVKARQARLMSEDVRLSPAKALSLAIGQMPNNYRAYVETRAVLARFGVPPLQFKDV